jgi:hypothetical protein
VHVCQAKEVRKEGRGLLKLMGIYNTKLFHPPSLLPKNKKKNKKQKTKTKNML